MTLPCLTSLVLSDVGLGKHAPPSPGSPEADLAGRMYALSAELARLAGSLAELALLNHTCGAAELDVLSTVRTLCCAVVCCAAVCLLRCTELVSLNRSHAAMLSTTLWQ